MHSSVNKSGERRSWRKKNHVDPEVMEEGLKLIVQYVQRWSSGLFGMFFDFKRPLAILSTRGGQVLKADKFQWKKLQICPWNRLEWQKIPVGLQNSDAEVRFGPVLWGFSWTLNWTYGSVQASVWTLDRTIGSGPVQVRTGSNLWNFSRNLAPRKSVWVIFESLKTV